MLIVEGGGDRKGLRSELREAFAELLKKAQVKRQPRIVAGGSRGRAFRAFCSAPVPRCLLVDSEEVVKEESPWEHVRKRVGDGWQKPASSDDGELHFMAVSMETWLCADANALGAYFGQGFRRTSLPQRTNVEDEPKSDINNKLDAAVKGCRKSRYDKARDSFEALKLVDSGAVEARCPRWAKRFFDAARSWK